MLNLILQWNLDVITFAVLTLAGVLLADRFFFSRSFDKRQRGALRSCALILIWGSNTLTSNLHLWPFIAEAQKAGARVIVIDPAETRTARAADEWIAIRPGTDGALALAMMHVIIGEGLHDADYVARYTEGFDALAARVVAWTPERAALITGVPAERNRTLARAYATPQPAARGSGVGERIWKTRARTWVSMR